MVCGLWSCIFELQLPSLLLCGFSVDLSPLLLWGQKFFPQIRFHVFVVCHTVTIGHYMYRSCLPSERLMLNRPMKHILTDMQNLALFPLRRPWTNICSQKMKTVSCFHNKKCRFKFLPFLDDFFHQRAGTARYACDKGCLCSNTTDMSQLTCFGPNLLHTFAKKMS